MKTIEQLRAANALTRVNKFGQKPEGFKKRYRAYVDRLCPTIVMNGLGQALAIERAAAGPQPQTDDEQAHHELYKSLQLWLCRREGGVYPPDSDLLQAIVDHDESLYLRAQGEALAWLEWHKKFCRAAFSKNEEE